MSYNPAVKKKPAARGKPAVVSVGAFSARIYSTPVRGTERFTLSWQDPARGRRRETFADFESAKRRAESVATSLQRGDAEAAGFTGSDRARFAAIIEIVRPTGVPVEIAVAQFAEAHTILGGRSIIEAARDFATRHRIDLPPVSVVDAVESFIQDRRTAGASDRYLSDLRSRLRLGFADDHCVNLGDLTPDGIREWLERRSTGPRDFNNRVAGLRTLLGFCQRRRWLPRDHGLLDGVTKRKAESGAIEIWSPEEMTALLASCPTRAVPALAISAFSGLRNAELLRLDWREVHSTEGFLEVPATKSKTASRRLAPCPPNLAQWLAPHAKTEGTLWEKNEATLHDDFRRAAKAAGLAWRENALRHSFVSYRLAEVQDVAKVALEAGNSPTMIFRHYREVVRPADAQRWFAIAPSKPANVVAPEFAAAEAKAAPAEGSA